MRLNEVEITIKRPPENPKLTAFMADLEANSHPHPLMTPSTRMVAYENSNRMVSFNIEPDFRKSAAYINSVIATPANTGTGTIFMKKLCEMADKHGVALRLDAMPFGRNAMAPKKLKRWYAGFGFEEDGLTGMIRKPK